MNDNRTEDVRRLARVALRTPKRAARKVMAHPGVRDTRRSLVGTARGLVPKPVRMATSRRLLRSEPVSVPIEHLLLGSQAGHSASDIASATGDLLWGSRRVSDGPHAALLRSARTGRPSDEELLASDYADLARACAATFGSWFGAVDDAGIALRAREFLDQSGTRRPDGSGPDDPILVAPIKWSSSYQVLDGHHRIARAAVEGRTRIDVVVKRAPATTPLMDHLLQMSWLDGNRELYQRLDLPDLDPGFTLVRRCTDRRDTMLAHLASAGITDGSYLDVASFYGWFVAELTAAGFAGEGIERDPLARAVGVSAYGLDPTVLHTGDAVEFLAAGGRKWDVVSCFSLLHHFVLGRSADSPEDLIRALDAATGKVLFFDTGQGTEAWFAKSLPEWTPDYIASWLRLNTTFDHVIDLGPDTDAVGAYADNYGRHLFALVRD